jgi:hypothetical protein
VRALDSQTLSTTATCFQCDGDGRRAGLKIWWGNTRVGSSPTFGISGLGRTATTMIAPEHHQRRRTADSVLTTTGPRWPTGVLARAQDCGLARS